MSGSTEPVFTLRELAERIGAPFRTVKFWADQQVIKAVAPYVGKGVPRVFTLIEARIASLLVPLAQTGLALRSLAWLADVFRRCFAARDPDNPDSVRFRSGDSPLLELLDRAIAGEGSNWLAVVDMPGLRDASIDQLRDAGVDVDIPGLRGSGADILLALASDIGGWANGLPFEMPGPGVWLPLHLLIPRGAVGPLGRLPFDRAKVVIMVVDLTARLACLEKPQDGA